MLLRSAAVALAALSLTASVAEAQKVVPLAGTGENFQPIARVELPRVNELELAGDWAFLSLDANEENQGGLAIVNIADPTKPFVESIWKADKDAGIDDFSAGDVDLSPDGNRVVLTNAHNRRTVEGQTIWAAIIDVTDKKKPKLAGQISRRRDDGLRPHRQPRQRTPLYMNPQVAAFYPQSRQRPHHGVRHLRTRPSRSRRARSRRHLGGRPRARLLRRPPPGRQDAPVRGVDQQDRRVRHHEPRRHAAAPAMVTDYHDLARRPAQPRPHRPDRRRRGRGRRSARRARLGVRQVRHRPGRGRLRLGALLRGGAPTARSPTAAWSRSARSTRRSTSTRAPASPTSSGRPRTRTA